MADGREDERATFQFIEEVQNCPDLWDVSSAAYKETKTSKFDPFAKIFLMPQHLPRESLGQVCCTLQGWDFY